jgi:hypothetical protein
MPMLQRVWSRTNYQWIKCNWGPFGGCDRDGYEQFKGVLHDHAKWVACDSPLATHINYVFCSQQHKDYYANSHRSLFNLPPGAKKIIW